MKAYTSVNAKHNFGQVLDDVQHSAVTITRHSRDIAVMFSNRQVERAKKTLLGEYFLEKVESGELDIFQALEAQAQILANVEQAEKDFAEGNCVKATPEMFEKIRKGDYLD